MWIIAGVILLLCASAGQAQTVAPLGGLGNVQFFDNNGSPLTAGVLYSFQAGTTTQQATYTDSSGTTQNPNPIPFGSGARAQIWLSIGSFYKFVLCSQNDGAACAAGDVLFTVDQVPGGSTGGTSGGSPFTGVFISGTVSPASSGVLRLASSDTICFRNAAGSTNLCFSKDANDALSWPTALKLPEIAAPSCSAGFDYLWADNSSHVLRACANGGGVTTLARGGVDISGQGADVVAAVHFGATQTPFSGIAPTTGQCLQWNGSAIVGAACAPALLTGLCSGTASSSSTLGLYGLGAVAIGCTNGIGATGILISTPRTAKNLRVLAITGGVNASSGVFTVLKNGAGTAITCTIGTGTSCTDLVNSASFAAGDRISIQFTTQAAETLGVIQATVEAF